MRLNTALQGAVLDHASNMARHSYFSHTGRDDNQAVERANCTGYPWRAIGENIASGQTNAEVAVQDWIKFLTTVPT